MMKYLIRRVLNFAFRGRWVRIRSIFSKTVIDRIGDHKLEYFLNTDVGNQLYYHGGFEKNEMALCARYLNENSNIIDIGSNIGIHSIFFAKTSTNGVVLAIEPQAAIYDVLLYNIGHYKNVVPLNIAIDSSLKISEFFVASDNAYSSLKNTERKAIIDKNLVVTIPFDRISDLFEHIDFVKIDVEGFEYEALKSMENMLRSHKPTLFVEIYAGSNSNNKPDETVAYLTNMGYSAYVVSDKGSLDKYIKHNDRFYNYFFLWEGKK
jgi:FkbM family methyltransferase